MGPRQAVVHARLGRSLKVYYLAVSGKPLRATSLRATIAPRG